MTDLLTALEAAQYRSFCEKYSDIAAPLDRALRECVAALEWYASREAWTIDQVEGSHGDYGTKAQQTLTELRRVLEGEK